MEQNGRQKVEIVRENLPGYTGTAHLLKSDTDQYFVVSNINAPYSGPETLVFKSDSEGEPTDWVEVAGGRGMSIQEAIDHLERKLKRLEQGEDDVGI